MRRFSKKVKIGLDGNEANVKNRVGSGKYALELLKEFAKNRTHSFKVYLKDQPLPDLPKESPNFTYKVFGPKKLWTQFALPINLTFSEKPNIFFSMGHYGPRFSPVPYVITVHDLSYLHFPRMFQKGDLYQLTNWTKYSIANSARIIAVSKTTKEDIIKNYQISSSKVTVIYEGYDEQRFKPQTDSQIKKIKSKYKITGDYLIFVGTIQPRKNIEKLIESFNIITNDSAFQMKNLTLVIVGKKGWLFDSIYKKVKSLKLEKKVIFTEYVPDNELPPLIAGAQVFILPSLWEGFGIPVIEAQACGVPTIVSNTSSLPELVGASGILINHLSASSIAEGLKNALNKDGPRQELIKKGFKNVKRFSWQKCAKETLALLEKVASESNL